MSPKRLPMSREEAERQIRDATAALAAIEERESLTGQIMATEPADRRIVRFSGRFEPGGRVYSFVAIRADNWRKSRDGAPPRWYVSQTNDLNKPVVLPSPATWVEIVEFAVPGSIYVAPLEKGWKPISNLPAASRVFGTEAGFVERAEIDWNRATIKAFFDQLPKPVRDEIEKMNEHGAWSVSGPY